jgi:hypothetical protein
MYIYLYIYIQIDAHIHISIYYTYKYIYNSYKYIYTCRWINKATAARDVAIIYNAQSGEPIEIVVEEVVAAEDEDE